MSASVYGAEKARTVFFRFEAKSEHAKAWLNVKQIDAPAVIKGALWTAAQIENNLGVFHADMISGINDFIAQKCPKAMTN